MKNYAEFRRYTEADMSVQPEVFNNDNDGHAKLTSVDMYGYIFPDGIGTKPMEYFRHANPDSYRFGSFTTFSDDYLKPQIGAIYDEIAQADAKVTPYHEIEKGHWGISSENPSSDYHFYLDKATFKESDFFEVEATPFPFTFIDHLSVFDGLSQIGQYATFKGTYKGKPIEGMGRYDRVYFHENYFNIVTGDLAYILLDAAGIRPDGRKEVSMFAMHMDGRKYGYYWLEGEQPIESENFQIDTEWVHLPYVDDGTVTFKDAVVKFGDNREVHYNCRWGTKGFTKTARIERHGQSQQFGTFYEGSTPYNHSLHYNFNEAMSAYDYNIRKLGFKVID